MKNPVYAALTVLLGINVSYAGESVIESVKTSVSPSVLSGTALPDASKSLAAANYGFEGAPVRNFDGGNSRCAQARAAEFLARLEDPNTVTDLSALARLVCRFSNEPAATVKYPDGSIAYVGPEYSDKGTWKYPNGAIAYVGPGYSDKGSWKYPNGSYAFVGEGWSDKGSWKYPSGKYALVGESWSDKGSWKYPNGGYALVGAGWSDKGSWKYPSGKYALVGEGWNDKGSWKYPDGKYAFDARGNGGGGAWYYPNGVLFTSGDQGEGVHMLTQLVEDSYNVEFPYNRDLGDALDGVNTMFRLQWIERTMPD